jgi:hypothetical protein
MKGFLFLCLCGLFLFFGSTLMAQTQTESLTVSQIVPSAEGAEMPKLEGEFTYNVPSVKGTKLISLYRPDQLKLVAVARKNGSIVVYSVPKTQSSR